MVDVPRFGLLPLKRVATINDEALGENTDQERPIRYVDIGNVTSDGEILDVTDYTFETAPSRARRIVRDGDVIISTVRTYLQAIASILDPPDDLVVSTGFAVVRPAPDRLDPAYCKYALREADFLAEVQRRSVGVSYPAITATELAQIQIAVPPLGEQRAIAADLDRETARLDALVAAKRALLDRLAEKRRALVARLVTRGLDPAAPTRDSGVPWLGEIPAHWAVLPLKRSLIRIEQGWSPQCEGVHAGLDEWGVLKVGAVNGGHFRQDEHKRLPDDLEPVEAYEVRPGDLLMSRANTTSLVGSIVHVHRTRPRLMISDKHYRLTVDDSQLEKEFVTMFLQSAPGRFTFERNASGASNSMQNISQDAVRELPIVCPPVAEQRAIAAEIARQTEALGAVGAETRRSVDLLRERRSALIAATVTGRRRVSA